MKVELSLYALKLKNVAGFAHGTSNPFAIVSLLTKGVPPRVLGQTEVVENTLSPNWVKVFVFDYELGTPCEVACAVHDKQSGNHMGSATFDIGQTLGAKGSTKAKNMNGKGTLYATVRKSSGSGVFHFKFRGENLTNREGWLRKSDPFFELCRRVEVRGNFVWDSVYRSHVVRDDLNPVWEEATVPLSQLCGGDLNLPIRIKVFDHERSGKHVLIGISETTVGVLVETYNHSDTTSCMKLMENNKDTGDLFIDLAEVAVPESQDRSMVSPYAKVMDQEKHDFVEYMSGGCNMRVVVGIDYTASNGDPRESNSLHHIDSTGASQNDYETALQSIVTILAKYDDDLKFPVFGFGAKFSGEVRNAFQVGNSAEVDGVQGVLQAYKSVFSKGLIMSQRPTDFTEVVRKSAEHAEKMQQEAMEDGGRQAYTILLIVTDGSEVDTTATVETLREIKNAPLSVVIVGVGSADFADLEYLDNAMKEEGRDMVNFVQYEKYRDNTLALTHATLKEIPEQLVGYFQSNGIDPLPPEEIDAEEVEEELESGDIDVRFSFADGEVRVSRGGGNVNEFDAFVPQRCL